jgi:hypothetical protein
MHLRRAAVAHALAGEPVRCTGAGQVRADVAEKMLVVLQHQLAEMTAQRDRWEVVLQARLTEVTAQRWEQRFDQLAVP